MMQAAGCSNNCFKISTVVDNERPKGQDQCYNNPTNQFDLDGFAFDEPLFADPLFADFLRDFFFGFNLLEAEDDLSCLLLCFFSFCTLILLTALSTLSVS
uniref:Uncharacterized protein n=1 Tax=Opuntia streptacantha TaxID=393608 RepID=A0A7C8ZA43_OPUST